MKARIRFSGPARYRIRSAALLVRSVIHVCFRRLAKGPRLPGWTWAFEIGTEVLKRQLACAFKMGDVNEARRFLDTLVLDSTAISQVTTTPVSHDKVSGTWFVPKGASPGTTLLYFHGGGYSFYPKASYANFVAMITVAAKCRTFAVDYRLSPEHRFPAQVEDALNAYRWMLDEGTDLNRLVVGGDSAGANLSMALLLSARDSGLPLPALAVCLSPPTDFDAPNELAKGRTSLLTNEPFDWINLRMLEKWADWFCDSAQRKDPLVSPLYADLRDLPPIYIHAGRAEILYDSIKAFADHAQSERADVTLESWEEMHHDFQAFGDDAPQSAEALRRLGEIINAPVAPVKQSKSDLLPNPDGVPRA
jgi:epsilon-lactone hydrolase